jgi:hypothetical protein
MNGLPAADRSARRVASLLLLACTGLALANLPGDDLPPGWLLAFVLPGALLAHLARFTPQPWQRALLAVVLQTAACWLALELVGPMSRPAALACTILPPLGFAAARHQEADQALALFLSFCVLLVGAILDGLHLPLLGAYGVCACLSLRCANHLAALAISRPARNLAAAPTRRPVFGGAGPLVLGCLFAVFAIERTLDWLPSPSRGGSGGVSSPGPAATRRIGLDDSFLLDGTRGVLSELTGEQLVHVRRADGRPLARDLYLRSGFFTVPGLDRWQHGVLTLLPPSKNDHHLLHTPMRGVPLQQLELERFSGARNFVFVPPASCAIHGLLDLVVDPLREWVRQQPGRDTGPYLVDFQVLPPLAARDRVVDGGRALGLLQLPRDLETRRYEDLLERWDVGRDVHTAMARIADGLARHCRYDRIGPAGPWSNDLDNFLFAEGDRRGYCMHFASAAALLLRLRGIPCRIGVGLYGGDADAGADGSRIFGSQHAHAWVEIPFVDRGYVVFDPTPPAERGQRMPSRLDTSGDDERTPQADPAAARDVLAGWIELLTQPWLLAALLVVALLASMWPRRALPPATAATPAVARSARRLLGKLLQALAAAGHARTRGQTLELFARSLTARQQLLPEVHAAFAAYQQVRFGGRPFDAAREQALRAGLEAAQSMPRAAAPALVNGDRPLS